MKYLYNKKGPKAGGGERYPFAFFAIGAVVILAAVFVIGLQIGRVVERRSPQRDPASAKAGASPQAARKDAPGEPGNEIRKDLGAFSEDAVKVPVVPPPDAKGAPDEVEKKLTFQETLPRKEDKPLPLVRPSRAEARGVPKPEGKGGRKYALQAGAYRDAKVADRWRRKIEKAGHQVRVVQAEEKKTGNKIHRVIVGPYSDKAEALKAASKLKDEFKINPFLTPG